MTLSKLVKELGFDADVHGFRTSFRTWAQERTNFPREVAEAALAHTIKDKAEAAYARSDVFEKRRKMMEAWAGFLATEAGQGCEDWLMFAPEGYLSWNDMSEHAAQWATSLIYVQIHRIFGEDIERAFDKNVGTPPYGIMVDTKLATSTLDAVFRFETAANMDDGQLHDRVRNPDLLSEWCGAEGT